MINYKQSLNFKKYKLSKKTFLYILITFLTVIALWFFFSFRLLEVPPGITSDEAAFGYNGVLLAETGKDENGRFLPVFVLSLDGKDWRQPITQYSTALTFKIFGSSYFNLRAVSVFIAVISTLLIFYLLYRLINLKFALFGSLLFITTPILMIQAHMGLDNIAPIPFTILWLLGILLYEKTGKLKYLVWSGVGLGLAFYSYKAMRIISAEWMIVTGIYLMSPIFIKSINWKNFVKDIEIKRIFYSFVSFGLALLPFFAVIPYLQSQYPGAVLGGQHPSFESYTQFFYYYLANLDPSFIYVKGDLTDYHSTGKHGMMLLATLPLFLIGAYQSFKKKGFWLFALATIFAAPLLLGLVGSVSRASRLLAIIPSYVIIISLGGYYLWEMKNHLTKKIQKVLLGGFMVLLAAAFSANYLEFINYYWYSYPTFYKTSMAFPTRSHQSYLEFSKFSKAMNLTPVIEKEVYEGDGVAAKFFEAAYFDQPLIIWQRDTPVPEKSLLLTNLENVEGLKRLEKKLPSFYLHIHKPKNYQ